MNRFLHIALGASAAAVAFLGASPVQAKPSYITEFFTWRQDQSQGQVAINLASATDHYCYMTGVSGHFVGDGEWVRVWAGAYNKGNVMGGDALPQSTWWIGGHSDQQGVSVSANCLHYSMFKKEPGMGSVSNWTGWISANTGPLGAPVCSTFIIFDLGCYWTRDKQQVNPWQGDAAVMISGMTGEFLDLNDYIQADQAPSPTSQNSFTVQAGDYNGIGGWAQGLFVGVPLSGFNPAFYGPNAGPAPAGRAGVYSAYAASSGGFLTPSNTTVMAPTDKAICYLSNISGAFAGDGESVLIDTIDTDEGQFWTLTVNSHQDQGTYAEARCYALDQSVSQH